MDIDSFINSAVASLAAGEKRRLAASERLSYLRKDFSRVSSAEAPEKGFSFTVEPAVPQGKICGVDSGFVSKRLSNSEIVFVRAVGVAFDYSEGKLAGCSYYPNFYRFPEPRLSSGGLDSDELSCSSSLIRLLDEVKAAKEMISRHSPSFCFLDGSVIPQYADKPRKESKVHHFYRDIIEEFQSLYRVAEKKGCALIGCVEDSRGSRVREIMQKHVIPEGQGASFDDMIDCLLLDSVLVKGERSFAFPYTSSIREHPILMDYSEEWAKSIYAFYLKPAELDRPLRVEFLLGGSEVLSEKAKKVASIVYSLSSMHREYAYPSVLIEADLRARLRPEEIDTVYNKIMDRLGAGNKMLMRRNCRPF